MTLMKRFVKRAGTLALALMLAAGMLLGVSARSFTDVKNDNSYAEQIDILSDMGIIVGTHTDAETGEAEFSPDAPVTREQMALLLFRFMLARSSAGGVNSSPFGDLYDQTYHGAISWANAAGYIIGTSSSTFEPTGGITLRDGMTMIVRALGHGSTAMDKGYPWTYIDAAIRLGLDNGLEDLGYTANLTRGQVAALLYNALTAEYLIPKTVGSNQLVEATTVIESVYGYTISESVLTATNNYALTGSATVKTGYVAFTDAAGKTLIVSFAQTGLSGSADEWLGRSVKLVYKTSGSSITVLGAFECGKTVAVDTASVADNNSHVTINGVNYNIVDKLSDSLSTNANELLVYVYGSDSKLVQLKANAELRAHLGYNSITLITDDRASDTANRAIITNYTFGTLKLDGEKINLAGGLTAAGLTGGYTNTVNAVNGDFVLYYFNSASKSLEIAEKLTINDFALVSELTADYAVIGGQKYSFGCANAGVDGTSIRSALAAGSYVKTVVKNGALLAVIGSTVEKVDSTYLVAVTGTTPVYIDGSVRYAFTANIGGSTASIIGTRSDITPGGVYRYIKDANNIYTLIASGEKTFTQNDDLTVTVSGEEAGTIEKGANGSFELGGIRFVTDSDTVIISRENGVFTFKSGAFASAVTLNAGHNVTAVFKNESGSVETLRFLFVDNGSLGATDTSTKYVRVLGITGTVYVDGKVYTVYSVFNFANGAIESYRSLESALTSGSDYALAENNLIINAGGANITSGIVTGYTANTITVDGTVYTLPSGTPIKALTADGKTVDVAKASLILRKIEFIASSNGISAVLAGNMPSFTAEHNSESDVWTFTCSETLIDVTESDFKVTSLKTPDKDYDLNELSIAFNSGVITLDGSKLENAKHLLSFSLRGVGFTVEF